MQVYYILVIIYL